MFYSQLCLSYQFAEDKVTYEWAWTKQKLRRLLHNTNVIENWTRQAANKMVKYVCLSCFKEISSEVENIFLCSKDHHFCAPCGKSMHLECEVCRKTAIKIPSQRNSIIPSLPLLDVANLESVNCSDVLTFVTSAEHSTLCPLCQKHLKTFFPFSAMNHCICWRWKMSKNIRMASSVWAIY